MCLRYASLSTLFRMLVAKGLGNIDPPRMNIKKLDINPPRTKIEEVDVVVIGTGEFLKPTKSCRT